MELFRLQRTAGWCEAVRSFQDITPEQAAEQRFENGVLSKPTRFLPVTGECIVGCTQRRRPCGGN